MPGIAQKLLLTLHSDIILGIPYGSPELEEQYGVLGIKFSWSHAKKVSYSQ